jgi:nitric oxide reductase activation protein
MTSQRDKAQQDLFHLLDFFWSIKSQLSATEWLRIDSIANGDYSLRDIEELKTLRGRYDAAYYKLREVEQGLIKLTEDINSAMLAKALKQSQIENKKIAKPAIKKRLKKQCKKTVPVNQWWNRMKNA